MASVSVRDVLQEAGLWDRQVGENLSGTANGSNTVFTTQYKPLVQNTTAESVGVLDVAAYVNGVPAIVTAVNASMGALTLQTAPAAAAVVSGDYVSSGIPSDVVAGVIEEADDWIALETASLGTVPASPTLRKIARFYAAGLLMSREYGLESITEETNKEGARKIKQAEAWLMAWRLRYVGNTSTTGGYSAPRSNEDTRIFQTPDPSSDRWESSDTTIKVQRRAP